MRFYLFLLTLIVSLSITAQSQETAIVENDDTWIGLTSSIGLQYIKTDFSPSFRADLRYLHEEKFSLRISSQLNYFFSPNVEGKTDMNINPFWGIGYSLYNEKDQSYRGIEISYLSKHEGDIFEDETFGLSMTFQKGFWEIKATYFAEDGFSQFYPAIGFSIGFY